LEVGLRKIVAVLTDDQTDARDIFTHLGLRPEALLADQVIDEEHRTYDLLIMSCAIDALVALPQELPAAAGGRIETAARSGEDARSAEPALVAASARDAIDAHPGTINAEESVATGSPAPSQQRRTRPAVIRRAYLAATVFGAVLMLAFGAFYLTNRHTRTRESQVLGMSVQPTVPTRFASAQAFESTRAGSGSVFLPMVRPATTVRVSVDPDVVGTWFWCIESSFGIPLAAHYCAAAGSSDLVTGELIAQAVVHIDPSWPAYALYFVQMYCQGSCVWHVQVAPR
jgi:hypothetical protein